MQSQEPEFEVIVIGGSYAGLAAGLALGRSLRRVLIIDSGRPCNSHVAHSHNFLTQDGVRPAVIAEKARAQILKYDTVKFLEDIVTDVIPVGNTFQVNTQNKLFTAKRLLFATGLRDTAEMEGFNACWGVSVLHCPYCDGYEVRGKKTGVMANGEPGFEFVKMISHWTNDLTLFTNGPAALKDLHADLLLRHGIRIVDKEIRAIEHHDGQIHSIRFKDDSHEPLEVLYVKTAVVQHSDLPHRIGCELTEHGYLWVDEMQQTTVPGIYAAGDNSSPFRALAGAVASGTKAGGAINKSLIQERFETSL